MTNVEPVALGSRLCVLLADSGFLEVVGGEEAYNAGIDALKSGLLLVGAELVNARQQGVDLSDAVFDAEGFPHTSRMHGVLRDSLDMEVPADVAAWVARIAAAGPLPDAPEVSRAIAMVAVNSSNVLYGVVARFALFELLCLQQRLNLRRDGMELEQLNGRRRDVETLAEQEVDAACVLAESSAGLLDVEDPLSLMTQMVTASLTRHVGALRHELGRLSQEVHDHLKRRQAFFDALKHFEPADAVLILNAAEDASGEERLAPAQLRRLHPLLLGDLSDDVMYKRLERMPERIKPSTTPHAKTFADVIIEAVEKRT